MSWDICEILSNIHQTVNELMSNLISNTNQTPIEINGNLHFSHIWDGESFWNFTNCLKCENEYFSDENIW